MPRTEERTKHHDCLRQVSPLLQENVPFLQAEKLALELKIARNRSQMRSNVCEPNNSSVQSFCNFERKLKNQDFNMSLKMPSLRKKVCRIKAILMKS